jgi:hypothetical protein
MDHRRLIPQARHIKQIVLWMDVIRSEQFAAQLTHFLSWPGIAVRKTASLPLAYVPASTSWAQENKDVDARGQARA